MFSLFKNKKEPEVNDRKDTEKEEGMQKIKALYEMALPYDIEKPFEEEDDQLDEARNKTGYNWFIVRENADIKKALEMYVDCFQWLRGNQISLFLSVSPLLYIPENNTIMVISGDVNEELYAYCHEHNIRLFQEIGKHHFKDIETKEKYALSLSEYPGMADDAATYGDIYLIKDRKL